MIARSFFHLGLLVEDIEAAMARFSETLGLTFTAPTRTRVDHLVEDGLGTRSVDITVAYSQEGPPYYELIESHPDGLYGRQHGEGFHHLGFWEPRPDDRLRQLTEVHGLRWEASQRTDSGATVVTYCYPDEMHGIRLELVDEARRPAMERWIKGGPWEE
jgi:catechol 2,3-dioxygenase-like lactoylglutathione lyase family enzyme